MKESYRILRTVVVIYDCSRLLFLLTLLGAVMGSGSPGLFRSTGLNLPFMMYAAPHALFPLMSFFLLIRLEISKAYIPLYITGKGFCILCLTAWLTEAFRSAGGMLRPMLWALFIAAADLGTVLGTVLLFTVRRSETGVEQNDARDGEAGADTPVFAETPEGGE
jgi:hypothetical protein